MKKKRTTTIEENHTLTKQREIVSHWRVIACRDAVLLRSCVVESYWLYTCAVWSWTCHRHEQLTCTLPITSSWVSKIMRNNLVICHGVKYHSYFFHSLPAYHIFELNCNHTLGLVDNVVVEVGYSESRIYRDLLRPGTDRRYGRNIATLIMPCYQMFSCEHTSLSINYLSHRL